MTVYFVQHDPDGLIKIGWTSGRIEKRLKAMQAMCPVPLVLRAVVVSDKGFEVELHATFAKHRVRGEWFRPAAEILQIIASHNAGDQSAFTFSRIKEIKQWLARNEPHLAAISELSGISPQSIRKLAFGNAKVPRPETINALLELQSQFP